MKKILVLTLVLGIASLATAGLDLAGLDNIDYSVSGQTVTITVDKDITGFGMSLKTDNGSQPSVDIDSRFSTGLYDGYWTGSQLESISASKGSDLTFQGTIISIDVAAGVTSIDLIADGYGAKSSIDWNDSSVTDMTGYTMTIPEPMTMGLLGLGGLFLRRKK